MSKKILSLIVIFYTFLLSSEGQSWNQTKFVVPMQAELSDENYRTIIIAEILNERNRVDQHTRDIYDELANRISEIDDFLLIDRQKTEALLSEFEFQQSSGLVNEDHIKKLGEFYSSGVMAFIRIQRAIEKDQVVSKSKWAEVNGCRTSKYREASFDLSVNVKLIDLQTGGIIFSKNIDALQSLRSKSYDCTTPPKFNKDELYKRSLNKFGNDFQNLFQDYDMVYTVEFQKHSKINEELKKAITYFDIKEFETGYEIISAIPSKSLNDKAQSSALYNLALVQLYSGKYSESLSNAKEAYILDSKNSECLTIIEIIE